VAVKLHETSIELTVPFHDIDMLDVVWHGHYIKYLELARTALMRSRKLDYADIGELGYRMTVVETQLRHTYPLRYDERVRVTAWYRDIDVTIAVAYDVQNLTHGRRAARGLTRLASMDADGNLLFSTPPPILARLRG
jgi:acyl-CoA thioester hydrolase